MTSSTAPRVYVTTDQNARIRAISNSSIPQPLVGMAGTYLPVTGSMLAMSVDYNTFYTAYFDSASSADTDFSGSITQPKLRVDDVSISASGDTITFGGVDYVLDETATVTELITVPIMQVTRIIETHLGYFVRAINLLDRIAYYYLDGEPMKFLPRESSRARQAESDLVECSKFVGHVYLVHGDHMDMTKQVATFDGKPVTEVSPKDYTYLFADDLSTLTVTKK